MRWRRVSRVRAFGLTLACAVAVLVAPWRDAAALESLDLTVPGASPALVETLRASSLLIAAQEAGRTEPVNLMAAARAEYGRLIGLLYEEAFFAPTIRVRIDGREATEMSSMSVPARIDRVEIAIELGPQFTFGAVQITPLAPGTVLPAGFAPGQPARTTVVRDAVAAALDGWRALGHAHVELADQRATADHSENRLNVQVRLQPGGVLRFGAVQPRGNVATRDDRIIEIAGLTPGATHDPAALAAAEARLRQTGAFASVRLRTADRADPDGTVAITAEVEEALPRRLGFGVEADSEAGARLSGFWLHRNLLGGAERFRFEASVDGIGAQVGGVGFTLDARFTRPATFNRDTDLDLGLRAMRVDERDYAADAIEAEALLTRRFSPHLHGSAGVVLRYEVASYSAITADFGTLGLPVTVTHDTRDTPLDARAGHYLNAALMPYAGFGSAQSGARLQLDARGYSDLGSEGRFVLAGRAQLGMILGSDLAATPRGFLFYSGGGGSVRGLPYQSLGVEVGGVPSGGRGFAAVSGEMRMRVNDSLSLAAFADAGQVSEAAFGGASDWHAGGGMGVRYDTPIGPLRFDLATPLRRNATAVGSRALQLYLGIGQAF